MRAVTARKEAERASAVVGIDPVSTLARDVAEGLAEHPKRLPAEYHYDTLGSQLFEAICELPWYTITRGERALLERHAAAIMSEVGPAGTLVELGSGSGAKLSVLLSARPPGGRSPRVHLVDISAAALELSALTLSKHAAVTVVGHESTYEVGLQRALDQRDGYGAALVLFLGSSLGNLNPEDARRFLKDIRTRCRPGDRLLLGADLVKPEPDLLLAYDDPLGVTAAFNKNVLARLNRELDADFDLAQFDHRVVWNADASRVESYLESQVAQVVRLTGAGCCVHFAEGERIWTESSYKYEPETLIERGELAGFVRQVQWIETDTQFALTLFHTE